MENVLYYTVLFDIYGELLTEKQKTYFKDYYFDNLSLAEIAENYGVSRNAIHNQLRDVRELLERYENTLHIALKNQKLEELVKMYDNQSLKDKIREIIEI